MKRRKAILILIGTSIIIGAYLFNFKSNIHFLFISDGETYNYDIRNQKDLYDNSDVTIRQINIRRKSQTLLKRMINKLSRPKLYFIEFRKNHHNFSVAYYDQGSTADSNVKSAFKFSINSAFYNSNFEPTGLIVVEGEKHGNASKSSGHFKVINGKAKAGPTSLFSKNINVDYSCQSHPSVMKNGVIWDYILDESRNQSYWKSRTYRSLVGQNAKGNICFIVSGNGGLLSIKEIAKIAQENNIKTATCLDAGAALQYAYKDNDYNLSFSSMNNILSLGQLVDRVFSNLTGKRFYNESPAFINYK